MTSPVDTSVKYFSSYMLGAQALYGAPGRGIAVLDSCLSTGWGELTAVSVVISSGVATATFSSDHAALVECVVLVTGATPAGLNGEQKITSKDTNILRWATDETDGTATGTIKVKVAPAGFQKVYTGTNLASYKSLSPQANGQYLRVTDTSTQQMRVVGYENMTAVSTGTNPFPTSAQMSGGYYWTKTIYPNTDPVPWVLVSDGRFFYFFTYPELVASSGYQYISGLLKYFGDTIPITKASDPFSTVLCGGVYDDNYTPGLADVVNTQTTDNCIAVPRIIGGTGTSARGIAYLTQLLRNLVYPDKVSGQVTFSRVVYADPPDISTGAPSSARSYLPGILVSTAIYAERVYKNPVQTLKFDDGRTYVVLQANGAGAGYDGARNAVAIDLTGPWRS